MRKLYKYTDKLKDLKLADWTNIAQIVSASVVVVTLFIILKEMKSTEEALRVTTYQGMTSDLNTWRLTMANENLTNLNLRVIRGEYEQLESRDKQQIFEMYISLWGLYESAFFANEREVIGHEEWSRYKAGICRNRKNHNHIWTEIQHTLTKKFSNYISNLDCSKLGSK